MTQLVGRILRQPHVAKTGRAALDACYVLCHDARTGEVVKAIKKSLEGEGMGDLALAVSGGEGGGEKPASFPLKRRPAFAGVRLFLPRVTWVEEDGSHFANRAATAGYCLRISGSFSVVKPLLSSSESFGSTQVRSRYSVFSPVWHL